MDLDNEDWIKNLEKQFYDDDRENDPIGSLKKMALLQEQIATLDERILKQRSETEPMVFPIEESVAISKESKFQIDEQDRIAKRMESIGLLEKKRRERIEEFEKTRSLLYTYTDSFTIALNQEYLKDFHEVWRTRVFWSFNDECVDAIRILESTKSKQLSPLVKSKVVGSVQAILKDMSQALQVNYWEQSPAWSSSSDYYVLQHKEAFLAAFAENPTKEMIEKLGKKIQETLKKISSDHADPIVLDWEKTLPLSPAQWESERVERLANGTIRKAAKKSRDSALSQLEIINDYDKVIEHYGHMKFTREILEAKLEVLKENKTRLQFKAIRKANVGPKEEIALHREIVQTNIEIILLVEEIKEEWAAQAVAVRSYALTKQPTSFSTDEDFKKLLQESVIKDLKNIFAPDYQPKPLSVEGSFGFDSIVRVSEEAKQERERFSQLIKYASSISNELIETNKDTHVANPVGFSQTINELYSLSMEVNTENIVKQLGSAITHFAIKYIQQRPQLISKLQQEVHPKKQIDLLGEFIDHSQRLRNGMEVLVADNRFTKIEQEQFKNISELFNKQIASLLPILDLVIQQVKPEEHELIENIERMIKQVSTPEEWENTQSNWQQRHESQSLEEPLQTLLAQPNMSIKELEKRIRAMASPKVEATAKSLDRLFERLNKCANELKVAEEKIAGSSTTMSEQLDALRAIQNNKSEVERLAHKINFICESAMNDIDHYQSAVKTVEFKKEMEEKKQKVKSSGFWEKVNSFSSAIASSQSITSDEALLQRSEPTELVVSTVLHADFDDLKVKLEDMKEKVSAIEWNVWVETPNYQELLSKFTYTQGKQPVQEQTDKEDNQMQGNSELALIANKGNNVNVSIERPSSDLDQSSPTAGPVSLLSTAPQVAPSGESFSDSQITNLTHPKDGEITHLDEPSLATLETAFLEMQRTAFNFAREVKMPDEPQDKTVLPDNQAINELNISVKILSVILKQVPDVSKPEQALTQLQEVAATDPTTKDCVNFAFPDISRMQDMLPAVSLNISSAQQPKTQNETFQEMELYLKVGLQKLTALSYALISSKRNNDAILQGGLIAKTMKNCKHQGINLDDIHDKRKAGLILISLLAHKDEVQSVVIKCEFPTNKLRENIIKVCKEILESAPGKTITLQGIPTHFPDISSGDLQISGLTFQPTQLISKTNILGASQIIPLSSAGLSTSSILPDYNPRTQSHTKSTEAITEQRKSIDGKGKGR